MVRGRALLLSLTIAAAAGAEPVACTDEATFLAALEAREDCVLAEGFEDGTTDAWTLPPA